MKYRIGLLLMVLFNNEIISGLILCVMAIMFLTEFMKEVAEHEQK